MPEISIYRGWLPRGSERSCQAGLSFFLNFKIQDVGALSLTSAEVVPDSVGALGKSLQRACPTSAHHNAVRTNSGAPELMHHMLN